MIFPFTIKYTKKLQEQITPYNLDNVLNYISNIILDKDGEEIHIDKNQLIFKSSFFNFRWNTHIFNPIEKGKFTIINTQNESFVTYDFYMFRMFAIFSGFLIYIGYNFQNIEMVLPILGVLVINWIITLIRHKFMFNRIISGINKLNITEK
jgi:hypothetical protein